MVGVTGFERVLKTGRDALLLAALVAAIAIPGVAAGAQPGDAAGALAFFEPVRGTLDAANPVDEWTLDGLADQPVGLLVTGDGSLDPVLEVIAPDGAPVATNDDLDSLVRDAGLEALILPVDGAYTVRVARYEGRRGATAGAYELLALPGYAELARRETFAGSETTWIAAGNGSVTPEQGQLRLSVAAGESRTVAVPSDEAPLRDLYYQAEARLSGPASYAEFGLVLRIPTTPGITGQGYTFKVNTAGQWTVTVTNDAGEFVLERWTEAPSLAADAWTLGVLAQDTTFSFYANGALLGAVTDGRLVEPGAVGLMVGVDAGQEDRPTVSFDNVVITRRLGSTYRGMPLALTAWADADPARVVAELARSGMVSPAPAHDLYINSRTLDAADPASRFELVGSERALYGDFILGASVVIVTDGESPGCGLLFRALDDRNLSLAYVDSSGGFGLVRAQDGALTTNVYDKIPLNQPNPDRLLIIARGERIALYVNGALVAQETLAAESGRAGVALLNYEDVVTRCLVGDMWVWPLVSVNGGAAGDE
ncbi:MAG: LamG domain-containing protein [Anaerolineae bacterium]|nr:LamG domain-containing protein [Anaerolineae bacterium]